MDRPTLVTQLLLIQHVLFNTQMALLALSLALHPSLCVCVNETPLPHTVCLYSILLVNQKTVGLTV